MGFLEAGRTAAAFVDGTEIVVTGTGIPSINPDRAGSGLLVSHGDIRLHFDAGRNTATRVIESGADVALWDHDLGVRADHNGRSPDPKVKILGFDAPTEPIEVWSKGDVRVLANRVRHAPVEDAVGYRVETPDGAVAISGDTIVCPEVAALADGADVVVYEAIRTREILELPAELHFITEYHADTVEIGAQMQSLGVPKLMLTHLIPAPSPGEEEQGFIDDVRAGGYTGEVVVCRDLDRVYLKEQVSRIRSSG